MRICLIPTDTWGVGCYRVLFPGRELGKHGHDVFLHLDDKYLGDHAAPNLNTPLRNAFDFEKDGRVAESWDADVYVLQRRMEQFAATAARKLREQGKRVIGEVDDNYDWIPETSPGRRTLERLPDKFRVEWMHQGLAECDVVTVSTEALAEHYARYNAAVCLLPNRLDWEMWEHAVPQYEVERPRIRIGWMGWLAWRGGGDLEPLRWLGPWLEAHPNVEFVSIGEPPGNAKKLRKQGHLSVHDFLGIPRRQRVTVTQRPFRQLAEIVATIDIGFVPLEPSVFNECKSYLKGLEYAGAGIPCVASPSGPYRGFVRDGETGFLARTEAEWVAAVETLVGDDDLRRRMGRQARALAETLTIQRHWPEWEAVWAPA